MASLVVLKVLNARAEHWTENTGELFNVSISRARGLFSFRTQLHRWMKPSCALPGLPFVWSCQSKLWFVGIAQIQGGWRHGQEQISIHRLSHILLQSNNLINASKAAPLSLGRVQAGDPTRHRLIRQVSVLHVRCTVPEHPSQQHGWETWGAAPQPAPSAGHGTVQTEMV